MKIYDAWEELKGWLLDHDGCSDHSLRDVLNKVEELEYKHE